MKTFKEEVCKFYEPYYRDGDEAHLIDHADDVCDLALKINQECNERLVILASYLHDLFNAKNRPIHNELAYEYVLKAEDKFLKQLNLEKVVRRSMKFNKGNAQGVYEHIKRKYGKSGYAKYPDVYQRLFKEELTEFKRLADELTVERILEICKELKEKNV